MGDSTECWDWHASSACPLRLAPREQTVHPGAVRAPAQRTANSTHARDPRSSQRGAPFAAAACRHHSGTGQHPPACTAPLPAPPALHSCCAPPPLAPQAPAGGSCWSAAGPRILSSGRTSGGGLTTQHERQGCVDSCWAHSGVLHQRRQTALGARRWRPVRASHKCCAHAPGVRGRRSKLGCADGTPHAGCTPSCSVIEEELRGIAREVKRQQGQQRARPPAAAAQAPPARAASRPALPPGLPRPRSGTNLAAAAAAQDPATPTAAASPREGQRAEGIARPGSGFLINSLPDSGVWVPAGQPLPEGRQKLEASADQQQPHHAGGAPAAPSQVSAAGGTSEQAGAAHAGTPTTPEHP